ncbi:putative Glucose-fructose oxidoreductase domain-containing protein 2 [Quillaja saponaria]|uniref:Glucose-fructose oxidoreductase domain-containing protein 2 n=1 Tax=Quillaja saponaria TaxID=32244 RepID=A0AAD7P9C7_QUISA|nr:putative Glucose-fructose oxidoreductase domain-containing protein 2 [Quillaja saponaria]
MGLLGSLEWVNSFSKKHCRRMKAALKKAVKNGGKQQLKFQYDPSSYALNFDDGCDHFGDGVKKFFRDAKVQDLPDANTATLVYVLWVKTK